MMNKAALATLFAVGVFASTVSAQQVTKEAIPGTTHVTRLETTVACGGATGPEAMPEIKKLGFKAVINLRQASEQGANIPAAEAAAKAAGLNYLHLPFNTQSPDPALVDNFLKAITTPANQPAYIHCASANRASGLWLIKRVIVDKWDIERATKEAEALGLTSPPVKQFALNYIQTHEK
jgi:uncharacterized protein (TIGR01244 family)